MQEPNPRVSTFEWVFHPLGGCIIHLRGYASTMSKVIYLPDRTAARSKVAAEIRAEIGRAGLNEVKVAAAAGIAQSTLNRKLKPKSEADSLTVDELERIADVLGVSVGTFFRTADSSPDGDDDGGAAGAPTRARTWDLRIKSP